jgi:hypothetical protein
MTSTQGTDTAYSAIAGNYLALAPECSDTIFGTNINYCQLVKDGTKKNGFLNGKFVDGYEDNPDVINAYLQLKHEFNQNLSKNIKLEKKPPKTLYDIIHMVPEASEIAKLMDKIGYGDKLQSHRYITFIAPSNNALNKARDTWLKTDNKYILKNLLDAHLLNYMLSPKNIQTRLLKVNTVNPAFWFVADGTAKFTSDMNFYQTPYTLLNNEYSLPLDRFKVEKIYMTDNGVLYIIDGMFSPDTILYQSVF